MTDKPAAKKVGPLLGCGLLLGLAFALLGRQTVRYTSADIFCDQACHSHPHATQSWIQSTHYSNRSGVVTHCTDCHLPPSGVQYLSEKARLGARDAYGKLFLDVSKIDWARERRLDRALMFTYDSSCIHCHNNLFSQGLSGTVSALPASFQETSAQQAQELQIVARRMEAHLYYQRNRDKLHCINCHIFEGHRMEKKLAPRVPEIESAQFPLTPSGFQNYTQAIPGANVKFHMIAVPGGTLQMGSPELGPCRQRDAGTVHDVNLRAFWMAESTVGSRELALFYAQHKVQAKDSNGLALTQQAAKAYTEWLSQVTGRKYRLPTEAELEHACMADGTMPEWSKLNSRADKVRGVAEVNAWGLADLPGMTPEFSVDFPQGVEAAWWSSERIGTSFRVVRESEESGPANRPGGE